MRGPPGELERTGRERHDPGEGRAAGRIALAVLALPTLLVSIDVYTLLSRCPTLGPGMPYARV